MGAGANQQQAVLEIVGLRIPKRTGVCLERGGTEDICVVS